MAYRQRSGNGCLSIILFVFFGLPCLAALGGSVRSPAPNPVPTPSRYVLPPPPPPPDPRIVLRQRLGAIGEAACQGTATPAAPVYRRGAGSIHPTIVSPSTFNGLASVHAAWEPTSVESAELVVCLGEVQRRVVEVCRYTNAPSITRYRFERAVRLVEIASGRTLVTRSIRGASPRHCGPREAYDLTELFGDEPDSASALTTLASWIQR